MTVLQRKAIESGCIGSARDMYIMAVNVPNRLQVLTPQVEQPVLELNGRHTALSTVAVAY